MSELERHGFKHVGELLHDPAFNGQLLAYTDDNNFAATIDQLESDIAERLDCTQLPLDEDGEVSVPDRTFPLGSTYQALLRAYERKCHTSPKELFAELEIPIEAETITVGLPLIRVRYVLPLAGTSLTDKAALMNVRYQPKELKRSRSTTTSIKLSRQGGGAKVAAHPYLSAKSEVEESDKLHVSNTIPGNARYHGRFGTV